MVALAEEALNAGHYSSAVADLADLRTEKHPRSTDVAPLFWAWLIETGVLVPSAEEATWELLRSSIGRVARAELSALNGLKQVAAICHSRSFPDAPSRYIGQPFGVTALYGAYSAYEELKARPDDVSAFGKYGAAGMAALSQHVVELSQLWWKVHGPSPSLAADSGEASPLLLADVPLHDRQLGALLSVRMLRENWAWTVLGLIAVVVAMYLWR